MEKYKQSIVRESRSVIDQKWDVGRKDILQGGTKKLLGVMGMFIIMIEVIVSWIYTYVKMYKIVYKVYAVYFMIVVPQ